MIRHGVWLHFDHVGQRTDYYVSSDGEIFSTASGRCLKPQLDSKGYACFKAWSPTEGRMKCVRMHQCVADAFLSNPQGLPEVNHIDEDKFNPILSNLEWCSHRYNMNHSAHKKHKVYEFVSPEGEYVRVTGLAPFCREMGLSPSNMCTLHSGRTGSCQGWRKYV